MFNKKGDLSLSTNAIVVLLMAIIVLGLAIGFTRGMFSNLESQLSGLVDSEPVAPGATASNPLTTSKGGDFTVSKGDSIVMKIGYYNPTSEDWNFEYPDYDVDFDCGSPSIVFTENDKSLDNVNSGSVGTGILIFSAPEVPGRKICELKVGKIDENSGEYVSQKFVMTVK